MSDQSSILATLLRGSASVSSWLLEHGWWCYKQPKHMKDCVTLQDLTSEILIQEVPLLGLSGR